MYKTLKSFGTYLNNPNDTGVQNHSPLATTMGTLFATSIQDSLNSKVSIPRNNNIFTKQ